MGLLSSSETLLLLRKLERINTLPKWPNTRSARKASSSNQKTQWQGWEYQVGEGTASKQEHTHTKMLNLNQNVHFFWKVPGAAHSCWFCPYGDFSVLEGVFPNKPENFLWPTNWEPFHIHFLFVREYYFYKRLVPDFAYCKEKVEHLSFLLLPPNFFFWIGVSPYKYGRPGTHRNLPDSSSWVLGLKPHATSPGHLSFMSELQDSNSRYNAFTNYLGYQHFYQFVVSK